LSTSLRAHAFILRAHNGEIKDNKKKIHVYQHCSPKQINIQFLKTERGGEKKLTLKAVTNPSASDVYSLLTPGG
jgi:hypothetical protein